MRIRRRMLPLGWYPDNPREILKNIQEWELSAGTSGGFSGNRGLAGVAPHAGWFFSGGMVHSLLSAFKPADTVVIIGGHLRPGDAVRVIDCDAFETPLGILENNTEMSDAVAREIPLEPDPSGDNTVEVLLPLVKYRFPDAKVFCLRAPPSGDAERLGKILSTYMKSTLSALAVIGSTDLTHYGPNYGFTPKGAGGNALAWVKQVNDKAFLDAACALDSREMIRLGNEESAACSAGAAAAAAVFALNLGLKGELLGYATSYDKHPSDSFVGYGIVRYA